MTPENAETLAAGFARLADHAAQLTDFARQRGADQETISRLDRIYFAASVGAQNASLASLRLVNLPQEAAP